MRVIIVSSSEQSEKASRRIPGSDNISVPPPLSSDGDPPIIGWTSADNVPSQTDTFLRLRGLFIRRPCFSIHAEWQSHPHTSEACRFHQPVHEPVESRPTFSSFVGPYRAEDQYNSPAASLFARHCLRGVHIRFSGSCNN